MKRNRLIAAAATDDRLIAIAAPVAIVAGDPDAAAGSGPAKFSVDAYTGGKLELSNFDLPVVVDLATLGASNSLVANLDHVTGVRYSGEFGHPFHVVDEELVILSVDHPFVPEGRVASLMVRDAALAKRLADGFETLWSKAMRKLCEIAFQPGQ